MNPLERDSTALTLNRPRRGRSPERATFELLEDEAFLELPTESQINVLVGLGDRQRDLHSEPLVPPAPTRPVATGPVNAFTTSSDLVLATEADGHHRPLRRRRDIVVETMVVLAALACIGAGIRPLLTGADDPSRPGVRQAIIGLVTPANPASLETNAASLETTSASPETTPAAEPPASPVGPTASEGALVRLGRDLRVSSERYEAVAAMFARNRLSCDGLREAYVEVSDGWTFYSIERARHRPELSEGMADRDEALYRSVQEVDANFTASGCIRP